MNAWNWAKTLKMCHVLKYWKGRKFMSSPFFMTTCETSPSSCAFTKVKMCQPLELNGASFTRFLFMSLGLSPSTKPPVQQHFQNVLIECPSSG